MAEPNGYDPAFLGIDVPLPRALGGRAITQLAYPRFSVTMDTRRRLAVATGVNIDGATLLDLERAGEWALDPRITPEEQSGPAIYADNDLDRGHLVRRRDPGWGDTDLARAAMAATFVYTNAAPQASVFNQSKDLWLGLEDHILRYAETTDLRLSVFTAPVLADDDPPYRGVQLPLRFWKIAAWSSSTSGDASALSAAGFVLDQSDLVDTHTGALSVAPLQGYRTFQVPIADIESLAGIDTGTLGAGDVMPTQRTRAASEWKMLRAFDDVVLR